MGKQEIEIKTVLGREEAARYLQELSQCLAGGKIVVQRAGEYVELGPQSTLELEIGAVRKKDKEKITLELSWRTEATLERGCELKISADAPPPPEPEPASPEPVAAQPPATAPLAGEGLNASAAPAETPGPEKDKAAKGCRK